APHRQATVQAAERLRARRSHAPGLTGRFPHIACMDAGNRARTAGLRCTDRRSSYVTTRYRPPSAYRDFCMNLKFNTIIQAADDDRRGLFLTAAPRLGTA